MPSYTKFALGVVSRILTQRDLAKEAIYFQDYLAFFNSIAETTQTPRKQVDEALFSLGRFLKTIYGWSIHGVEVDVSNDTDEFN